MGQTYIGKGELEKLKDIVRELDAKRIFLVTGKQSYERSGLERRVADLINDRAYTRFCDFAENPQYEDVLIGMQKIQAFSPDLIVGIGGGSPMDMAKLLSVLSEDVEHALDIIEKKVPVPKRTIKLVLIPTTAGTGSEATHFAVVYVQGVKYSVASPELLPDYAIVDAELTYTAPAALTAVTAFDALSQAIESYWSVTSTPESREYASESIQLIMQVFDVLVTKPDDRARGAMMHAAHLAGKAINITTTTAAHALSYGFTSKYGIPHGHAVMLTLPDMFVHNTVSTAISDKLSPDEHRKRMSELCELLSVADAYGAAAKLKDMVVRSGLAAHLSDMGIEGSKEVIDALVAGVNVQRLQNNPTALTEDELRAMIASAF